MVIRTEKDRIKSLVIDTVKLLCKNGLPADCGFSIEGMIGVTSLNDEDDVFLIPIKEIINSSSTSDSESEEFIPSPNKKKRKNKSDNIVNEVDNSVVSNIKLEDLNDDSDSGDLVMVKEEPARQTDDQLMIPTFTPAVPIQHTVTQWQPNEGQHKDNYPHYAIEDMKNIAQRIATTEGMFLTVRLVKRRVSRYPTGFIVKTMREYMSRSPNDPLFLGYYREPPRTKVFYKCPPAIIKDEALAEIGISRTLYIRMYHSVPKIQKWDKPEIQGRLLLSVLEASPFVGFYEPEVIKKHTSSAELTPVYAARSNKLHTSSTNQMPPVCLKAEDLRKNSLDNIHANSSNQLAALYSMTNEMCTDKLRTNSSNDELSPHIDMNKKSNLSPQQYAEKAIMKTMYGTDNH